AAGGLDYALVHPPGFLEPTQFLQRLASVVVRCGVIGIGGKQKLILLNAPVEALRIGVLHRQPVARKAVGRILRDHVFQNFHAIEGHAKMLLYLPWRVLISTPGRGFLYRAAVSGIYTRAAAAPTRWRVGSPIRRRSPTAAILDTRAASARIFRPAMDPTRSVSRSRSTMA